MTEQTFNEQMTRLVSTIQMLPNSQRATLMQMVQETRKRYRDIRESGARSRNALDNWRLIQKYRIFDEEARAREARTERDRRDASK